MNISRLLNMILLMLTLLTLGCGPASSAASGEHDKLMNDAHDLSIKILNEVKSGKDVPSVNATYVKQIAELETRIAKLPKLTSDETIKLMHALGSKFRDIDEKMAAIALHGPLPKLPTYTLDTEEKPTSGN